MFLMSGSVLCWECTVLDLSALKAILSLFVGCLSDLSYLSYLSELIILLLTRRTNAMRKKT